MSYEYQEDSNSEAETKKDIQYNTDEEEEESHRLGLSILDYKELDLEIKHRNNKRSYDNNDNDNDNNNNDNEESNSLYTKKIKIIEKDKIKETKEQISNSNEEKEKEEDYLLTCPICLEYFSNKTLLNPCYHSFCYICIKKWSKVSQQCPLCKQTYNFAIFNIKDEYNFDKVYFGEKEEEYNKNHKYSLPFSSSSGHLNPSEKDEIEYRREVYRQGLYSKQTEKYNVLKENQTFIDYFSKNKAKFNRIIPWIERDLKAILHTQDIGTIRDFILSVLKTYDLNSEEAKIQIAPFLTTKTNHFIHELKCFINSPFNIKTYDRQNLFEKKSEHKIPLEAVANYYLTQQKLKEKNKGKQSS